MATQYSSGFSLTAGVNAAGQVQQAVADCLNQMSDANESPDWSTLQVVTKDLPTGWPQMPVIVAYGVLLSSE